MSDLTELEQRLSSWYYSHDSQVSAFAELEALLARALGLRCPGDLHIEVKGKSKDDLIWFEG